MKLTPAEYKLLDRAITEEDLEERLPHHALCLRHDLVRHMFAKGLISKRAWTKGYVVATALGKRSHARGNS